MAIGLMLFIELVFIHLSYCSVLSLGHCVLGEVVAMLYNKHVLVLCLQSPRHMCALQAPVKGFPSFHDSGGADTHFTVLHYDYSGNAIMF